jgi:hypothetical protein
MKKPSASPAARLSSSARMVALLKQLAPQEGYTLTALAGVRFLRSDRPLASTPVLYEPGIVIVCQGRKRGLWADQVYLYDAQHYLAVSVPVPFTMETDASADEPLLAIYFSLDLPVLAALALQVDELTERSSAAPLGMFSTPMDDALAQTVLRFLEAMSSPVEAVLLGPAIVREIYFRVLIGEQGASMRAALAGQGQFGKNRQGRAAHPRLVRRTSHRHAPGPRGGHEHSYVSRPLSQRHPELSDAVPQVGAPASSAPADAAQREDRVRSESRGGI